MCTLSAARTRLCSISYVEKWRLNVLFTLPVKVTQGWAPAPTGAAPLNCPPPCNLRRAKCLWTSAELNPVPIIRLKRSQSQCIKHQIYLLICFGNKDDKGLAERALACSHWSPQGARLQVKRMVLLLRESMLLLISGRINKASNHEFRNRNF